MKARHALILAAVLVLIVSGCESKAKPEQNSGGELRCSETEITFSSGGLKLYGTFDLPSRNKAKLPAVVLVHGSGPNDRDETVGAVKPFQDIGRGLAERGIAVLRYDKRTFTYATAWTPQQIADVTLDQEVIDDALAAVRFLRKRSEVDPGKVFVLGHSLGGWAAPIIAKRDPKIAGIIMLAASAADIDKTIIRQIEYRSKVEGAPKEAVEKQISDVRRLFGEVRAGSFPDEKLLLGASGRYWKGFFARDPVKDITQLPQPALILQGDKDYQVTVTDDLPIWEKALKASGKTNYKVVRFPTHNHLFVSIKGESTGEEYKVAGHVDPEVIDTIAAWVKETD